MRLIDADELKKKAYPFPCAIGVEKAVTIRAINEAPTIESTMKRGKWIEKYDHHSQDYYEDKTYYVCSCCEEGWLKYKGNFCPNCCADMGMEDKN